jgi:hypothetical protein
MIIIKKILFYFIFALSILGCLYESNNEKIDLITAHYPVLT